MSTPSIAANAYASLARLSDPGGATKGAGEASAECRHGDEKTSKRTASQARP